ncbi:MAG: bacteriohemerythrin [Terriglobales bacterium]
MALIRWDESYSVNVSRCDADHKELFAIVGILHDAMSACSGAAVVRQVIEKLSEHTQKHFSNEEWLMEKTGFSGLDAHRIKHQELQAQVDQFRNDIAAGTFVSSVPVAELLDTMISHTTVTDREYTEHLNAYGIF